MPSYNYASDVEPESGIIVTSARFLLRCVTFPFIWTAKTMYNNFLAMSALGASVGMVYLGGRNENRLYRLYYYLTAAALLSTHLFIIGLTCGTTIPPPDIMIV